MNMAMVFRWAAVLGAVGFFCGFVGPLVLAPDANQGPLFGIFISGPAGAVLGALLGMVVGTLGATQAVATPVLVAGAAVVAATTLYFCVPDASVVADVVDARVTGCAPAAAERDRTVARLENIAASRPGLPRPVVWSEAYDRALAADGGAILTLHIERRSSLRELRARWNRGTLLAGPWRATDETQDFVARPAGTDCGRYPAGTRMLFAITGHPAIWPPARLAEMLGLQEAAALTAREAAALRADAVGAGTR